MNIKIIVDEHGVERVQMCGQSWDDQGRLMALYSKIERLVDQIDQEIKATSRARVH